jgi:hypothetical protein
MAVDLKLAGAVTASRPRELFALGIGITSSYAYEPEPGGRRFLTLARQVEPDTVPWNVVVNWPATLLRSRP